MQFFEIVCGRGDFSLWFEDRSPKCNFPHASGYGPLPSMPFLDAMPAVKSQFIRFWTVNRQEPGLHIDSGRGKMTAWPDFLMNGNSPPSFFVSETVIRDLGNHGISTWRKTEMPIASNQCSDLETGSAPKYFTVEVAPGIDYDFAASGLETDESGQPLFTRQQRLNRPTLKLNLQTWNRSDLFSAGNFGGRLTLLCTEKVVRLAEKKCWTNLRFDRLAGAGADPWKTR